MRLEAQDEKARAELTLGRRKTKGRSNRARRLRAEAERGMEPNGDWRPHIFGQEKLP